MQAGEEIVLSILFSGHSDLVHNQDNGDVHQIILSLDKSVS